MSKLLHKLKRFIEIKPSSQKLTNYLLNKLSKFCMSNYALGMPHRVFLEITNSCNLKCRLCPTGNGLLRRNKTTMSFGEFKEIIDKMANYLIEVSMGGFGEPFLNEDIYRMLEYIKNKKIFVEIYTNLACLDKDGLKKIVDYKIDKLVISLDASDEDIYSYYKGVDGFQNVISNLRYLSEIKKQRHWKRPLIDLQFIMIKDNVARMDKIEGIAKDMKLDILSLKTPNLYLGNFNNYPDSELEKRFLSEDFNRYGFNGSKVSYCTWVWDSLIIYANGDIGPCCYDAQGDYILGNILLEKIEDIWNNSGYKEFRRKIVNNTNNNLCKLCMERYKGAKVKIEYPINKLRF